MLNLIDFLALDAGPQALLCWGLSKLGVLAAALLALALLAV